MARLDSLSAADLFDLMEDTDQDCADTVDLSSLNTSETFTDWVDEMEAFADDLLG
jgi:hypothetical protein